MKTIWKVPLAITNSTQVIHIPKGAKIVKVGLPEPDAPTFWMECNPQAGKEERHFMVTGTGHYIDDKAIHLGSVIDHTRKSFPELNPLVWHIWEVTEITKG